MSARGPALVVLAAGASARLGQPKALARLRPGTPGTALELLLAAARELGDPRPLLVVGAHAREISAAAPAEVELLLNPLWRAGRTGGVALACERRAGRDLCLAPIDVPLVPGEVFAALAREWNQRGCPARGWLGPSFGAPPRFGHPVIVGRELLRRLKEFPVGQPLSALRAESEPLLALPVACAAILDDLDSPADLERLRARASGPPA